MDSNVSFFSLPFGDADNGDFAIKGEFHHVLPSGSLLEADAVLEQFLSTDGPLEEPDLNGPTTLHCEICQKKFDNAKKYYGHLRVHSKHNLWTCDKCPNQKFSTKQQLMKHSLTHKPLEKVWKCQQCPMAFEALYRLQQHLFAKHLNYRPHKCDICNNTFQKMSDLKKHQTKHTGLKEHICKICSRGFSDKSNLGHHMLSHSEERNHQCMACRRKFKQLSSLKRHMKTCIKCQPTPETTKTCRVCGLSFQFKSALLEHCVREHSNGNDKDKKEETSTQNRLDNTSAVDTIFEDILSVEDDYSLARTTPNTNDMLNFDKSQSFGQVDPNNADNLMHIEIFKEINQLQTLDVDDELLYNDIFEAFQSNQVLNPNELDTAGQVEKNEILFDFSDCGWSMDQDFMNALYQVKADNLPDELLNAIPDVTNYPQTGNTRDTGLLDDPISINECATIFESDIDLEASTSLAMNLNQLIGENNVQFISTEDDDTFIISLDSGIDAEKLSDILNIGVEFLGDNSNVKDKLDDVVEATILENMKEVSPVKESQSAEIVKEVPEVKDCSNENKDNDNVKSKKKTRVKLNFVCRTCGKIFYKKDNWRSHLATHNPSLRRHACLVCGKRFSYRSTLNKHCVDAHEPRVFTPHTCHLCDKNYKHAWMLKNHLERDHEGITSHKCDFEGCKKQFYKKSDLDVHKRYHTGERPYACVKCDKAYQHVSHLRRHYRSSKGCSTTLQKSNKSKSVKLKYIKGSEKSLLKQQIVIQTET